MTRASSASIATTTMTMPSFESALAVAQHRFADVADARAVDEDVAAVRLADLVAVLVRELEHVAVFDDEDVLGLDAGAHRELPVLHEHPVLAVDRDEELRPHEVEHQQQLFLRARGPRRASDRRFRESTVAPSLQRLLIVL